MLNVRNASTRQVQDATTTSNVTCARARNLRRDVATCEGVYSSTSVDTDSLPLQRELGGVRVEEVEDDSSVHYESLLSVSHLQMIMELSGCTPGQFPDP